MNSLLRTLTRSTHVEIVSDDIDLSTWELVTDSLSDDDVCSFYGDEIIQLNDVIELNSESETENEEEVTRESRDPVTVLLVPPPVVFYDVADDDDDDDVADDDDDVEEDFYDYDDDDLEDELVPCNFKNRFGKQRVKKVGKTGGPKPKLGKSKKLAYHSNNTGYASRC